MDTILFGLVLSAALVVIFTRKRWMSVVAFSVSFVAIAVSFLEGFNLFLPDNPTEYLLTGWKPSPN